MKVWSLRKIQAFVFFSARTANEASYGRGREDVAGITAVAYFQTVIALTVVCCVSAALHRAMSQSLLVYFLFATFWLSALYSYLTLVFREQWRQFANDFRTFTADDLIFTTMGGFVLAFAWAAWLIFWAGDVTRRTL